MVKENEKEPEKNEEAKEIVTEEQLKKENKILRNFFIVVGFVVIAFIATWFAVNYSQHFNYKGIRFDLDKNQIKDVTLYRTSLPLYTVNPATGKAIKAADYNFYFRNDPRELENKIPITGDIIFRKNIVLDVVDKNLTCSSLGSWNLGQATLLKLNTPFFGTNVTLKDKRAKYKPSENYMFITINNKANTTGIVQKNGTAYYINIQNCDELLPAAERLLADAIVRYKELNK